MARVRLRVQFRRDFRAQLAWLIEHDRTEWIPGLAPAIQEVTEYLARFPEAGPIQAASRRVILRKLILRRLPYVAWYAHSAGRPLRVVWLLRLFGARQDRPRPDPDGWDLT